MQIEAQIRVQSVLVTDAPAQTDWNTERSSCTSWERRRDSEPAIVPSVLFDEETANRINWQAYYPF